jgi:hypothetical protein
MGWDGIDGRKNVVLLVFEWRDQRGGSYVESGLCRVEIDGREIAILGITRNENGLGRFEELD